MSIAAVLILALVAGLAVALTSGPRTAKEGLRGGNEEEAEIRRSPLSQLDYCELLSSDRPDKLYPTGRSLYTAIGVPFAHAIVVFLRDDITPDQFEDIQVAAMGTSAYDPTSGELRNDSAVVSPSGPQRKALLQIAIGATSAELEGQSVPNFIDIVSFEAPDPALRARFVGRPGVDEVAPSARFLEHPDTPEWFGAARFVGSIPGIPTTLEDEEAVAKALLAWNEDLRIIREASPDEVFAAVEELVSLHLEGVELIERLKYDLVLAGPRLDAAMKQEFSEGNQAATELFDWAEENCRES